MDSSTLKQYYRQLPDFKIIRLATEETDSLSAEALNVLKAEIETRKLGLDLDNLIKLQANPLNDADIGAYEILISSLPCPYCGQTNTALNGSTVYKNIGFIIFSIYTKELKVGCPSCLDRLNFRANLLSAVFGWWGIPWGIINTVKALRGNYKSHKENSALTPNSSLRKFIKVNHVLIEANKDSHDKLFSFIKHSNTYPKT